jgi:hypothetical protein
MTQIEILTKADLLNFKHDLIEEIKSLLQEKSKSQDTDYLKSKEVKRILKCSDSTLQYYRQSGKLSFKKIGGTFYYTKEAINRLMEAAISE